MHPAVQEAMGRYAAIWEENDELRTENGKLQKENEVLRSLDKEKSDLIASLRKTAEDAQTAFDARLNQAESHLRERLAEAERAKERYLRYAVSMSERIQSSITDLQAMHDVAMDMAHSSNPTDKAMSAIQKAITEAEDAVER